MAVLASVSFVSVYAVSLRRTKSCAAILLDTTSSAAFQYGARKIGKPSPRSKLSKIPRVRVTSRASPTGDQMSEARRSLLGFRSRHRVFRVDIGVLRTMPRLEVSANPNPRTGDRYPFQLPSRQDYHSQSHKSSPHTREWPRPTGSN